MSILEKLTEGVVNRDMKKEGAALLEKWERTGLLEGLNQEQTKNGMARLLENQAKELLREAASTMAGGDVEGFAAVAFPIVRRVFGSLIANDLVSVQPMSLPSGLIFFLDFTFGGTDGGDRLGFAVGDSLYGGGKVGQAITGGVDLSGDEGTAAGQFYNLTNGYSSPTASILSTQIGVGADNGAGLVCMFSGTFEQYGGWQQAGAGTTEGVAIAGTAGLEAHVAHTILQDDPDLVSGSTVVCVAQIPLSTLTSSNSDFDRDNLVAVTLGTTGDALTGDSFHLRRLTQFSSSVGSAASPTATNLYLVVASNTLNAGQLSSSIMGAGLSFPIKDAFVNDGTQVGAVVGADTWGLENNTSIPEINLKVDSVSVTAMTKKLKAKWTPELGQDLNAYHNLDAEVELTSILSEQIALEIDREIVEDLVRGCTGAVYHWARSPGLFVDKTTGAEVGASSAAPDFTGTVSEWYETLIETINDVSAQIHRKTLRGGANFMVTSPEVANILEFTSGFRANITVDDNKGIAGTQNVGSISKRYDVYVDPYFPRNLVLVGRKGNSFLESGYVYAPYVPLQVTPTIFGPEDFVPRKGVMTRYAKKMVRPDMYGLVIIRGLLGESGATS
tara:strand:+ start:5942 stop:7786 length:1845 start_codon:yes stop_codon:yes gene_type:complete